MQNGLKLRFTITCKKCGKSWECRSENPKECIYCRSRAWFKEPTEPVVVHVPLPKVDHSVKLHLSFIGGKCPYCRGTTGIDNYERVAFCYSCDATFHICSGEFLGVLRGIGVR